LDDEDEESGEVVTQPQASLQSPSQDPIAAFGFQAPTSGELSLTQMFAGTIADPATQRVDPDQDSLAFLREIPPSTVPEFNNALLRDSNPLIEDSQRDLGSKAPQDIKIGISQLPSQPADLFSPSKMSENPEPTQDAGFEVSRVPVGKDGAPESTIDTVLFPLEESPEIKKKGRLRRRAELVAVLSDAEDMPGSGDEEEADQDFELSKDAFSALFKASKDRKQAAETFDKKRSAAKNLVEEQAEESEDEYAGLGGASDDESTGDMDEELKKMIEEGPVNVNEREIAAFFA
jgi:mediator of replication checkpoint protein 1